VKKTFRRGGVAGSSIEIKIDTDKLEEVHAALLAKYVTRVGILGKKGERKEGVASNAAIGLVHEKGSLTRKIPRRSFLEMPLVLKSEGLLACRDLIWQAFLKGENSAVRLKAAYRDLGHVAERIVQAAFMTRGFGKWAPNSAATIARKRSSAPLIDTGQLRRSITSDVVTK
jgi:hypothetical protein